LINILHVEPDVGIRAFIKQRLEECDSELNILSIDNVIEATSIFTNSNIDLILVHSSPIVNSLDLIHKLKGIKNKPVLVYSTEGEESSNRILDIDIDFSFVLRMSKDESLLLINKIKSLVEDKRKEELTSAIIASEQRLRLLHEFAPRIINERNIDNLVDSTLKAIDAIFDSEILSYLVVEDSNLVFQDRRWKRRSLKLSLEEENILTRSVREGRSFTNNNLSKEESVKEEIIIRSELSVPIKNNDMVVAVLDLRSSRPNNYTKEDIYVIEALGRYISCAYSVIAEIKAINSSDTRYQRLLDSLGVAVYVFSDSQYIYINQRGAELLGYKNPSEITGGNISVNITKEYITQLQHIFENKFDEHSVSNYEMKLIKKDGVSIDLDFFVSSIIFDGKPAYLTIETDVKNLKSIQEQLQKYTNYLESQIEKRSNELAEAQQFASAGKLASMVGHDLRNPLQSIKNATYLIQKQPERSEEMLNSINTSVDRALSMLEDLRYKTMETSLKIESIEINKLINDILHDIVLPDNIILDIRLDSDLKQADVDSLKIRRVIENLIKNAIEAMPKGGKLIIESKNEGEKFRINITDTGVGISQDRLANLFKPFYTTKSNGLGLGLAFSNKAIEAHGGTIEVESKINEGTKFTITLRKNLLPVKERRNNQ
jgi:PAS domain S-box-containing protein